MNSTIQLQPLLFDTNLVCFVVPALFSKAECEELLNSEVKNSFQKAISNYPTYYRNNDRLVIDSDALATQLFAKVKPFLPETIETQSEIAAENGIWKLSELNNRLRFCKYAARQYFHRHLDGVHYRSETKQSKLTFMIYLNSATEFEGGRTLFYRTKDTDEIWAAYSPQQGDLIVFDHNIWHEGEELQSGEKYVLRSDILYEKANTKILEQPFGGHLGYIWKILKFDDHTLLSGGRDKVIKVWNTEGKCLQTLAGHENSILCIEKLNEDTFISGSRDKQIHVWRRRPNGEFQLIDSICNHSAVVLSVSRLSDNLFASSSGDTTIKIVTVNGQILQTLTEHQNWVWQVITIDAFHIASCSEDNTIRIWDYRQTQSLKTFTEDCPIICLTFDPSQRQLISGNLKGELVIRTLDESFAEINTTKIQAHTGIIRTVVLLDEQRIASGGEDNKVKIWDRKTGVCLSELPHQNFVQSLTMLSNDTLLSASYDGTIKVWKV